MNNLRNDVSHETTLADKDVALNDYLDVLLQEVTEIEEKPAQQSLLRDSVSGQPKMDAKFQIENDQSGKVTQDVTSNSEPSVSKQTAHSKPSGAGYNKTQSISGVDESLDRESSPSACELPSDADHPEEDYCVEGAPEWAHAPFQALEFTVAKLKLVIPLVQLCGILDWERADLTPMPGHSQSFLGVWPNHGTNSKIVDVAEMVVPDRYHSKITPWRERVTKVVLIDESTWGLACDEIVGVVTLDPREIRWRTNRTQRAWLAGTLIEHMSALIDGNEFAAALLSGENEV